MSLTDVADMLACPRCLRDTAEPRLTLSDGAVRCAAGHTYDVARQGYVNLLGGPQPRNADTAAMIAARDRFLDAGHYAPIAEAIARTCRTSETVVEAGAGTGYYLRSALAPGARGVALDISVAACKLAARKPGPVGVAVADTWAGLPVADASADALLTVFAPKNLVEFARVVRPGGIYVDAAPTPDHLAGLREDLGLLGIESDKAGKLERDAAAWFEPVASERVDATFVLPPAAVADLVAMGPNAFHEHGAAGGAEPREVRVSVIVTTLLRRNA